MSNDMSNPTNEHMARVLAAHGVPKANIERLIQARQKQADWVQSHFPDESNPTGGNMSNEAIQQINASLKEVGGQLRDFKAGIDSDIQGVKAQMQHIEQVVASNESRGSYGGFEVESIGAEAARKLAEDPAFQSAVDAVGRGVRAQAFSSRVNLDSGIRAAVTNVGWGQPGDTSIPSDRERGSMAMPVQPRLRLLDVLPSRPVGSNEIEYVRLSTSGDAAEQLAEGDEKAEVDVAGELATARIATVAAHTDASRQILDDSRALGSAVNRLLAYKVLAELERLLVNGTGGENSRIEGLLHLATAFTPTLASEPADIVGEALTEMRTEGYAPNVVVLNPRDWFALQITRRGTDDAGYIYGSPTQPIAPNLWNAPVVTTPAVAQGTGLVIDTAFTTVLDRMQASVLVATEHKDNFVRNLVTILAELRAGLEVTDEGAVRQLDLTTTP